MIGKIVCSKAGGDKGSFLVFISRHISDTVEGNIYSFIGEAYGSMEIRRIKGTIVLSE